MSSDIDLTAWKERYKTDGRPRMTPANRRRQQARLAIKKARAIAEGTAEPFDIEAVKAAVEKWRLNQ